MPITRVLQAPGMASFKLDLPTRLQRMIMDAGERRGGPGAHISVFPVPLERPTYSQLSMALWTGFCDQVSDDGTINAVGIEWWMRGLLARDYEPVARSIAAWSNDLTGFCGFYDGTTNWGGPIPGFYPKPYAIPVMEVVSQLAARAGTFWRVDPDFTFRFMSPADRAATARRLLIAENIAPVSTAEWVVMSGRPVSTYDDGQVAGRVALATDSSQSLQVIQAPRNLRYHFGVQTLFTVGATVPKGIDPGSVADQILWHSDAAGQWTIDVKVAASEVNPLRVAKPGDMVGVWSPRSGVVGVNPVYVGGWTAFPRMLQLTSITTPISRGLGVAWWRNPRDPLFTAAEFDQTIEMIDLTPYVVWETSATTIQVERTKPWIDDSAAVYAQIAAAQAAPTAVVQTTGPAVPDPAGAGV